MQSIQPFFQLLFACLLFFPIFLPAQLRLTVEGDGQLSGDLKIGQAVLFGDSYTGAGNKLFWLRDKAAFRAGSLDVNGVNNWDVANIGMGSFAFGQNSKATATLSFVGGGLDNTASGDASFIGGGALHIASGRFSFIAGGGSNEASGDQSFSSGSANKASGGVSFIGGGSSSKAIGFSSFIGGGESNTASGNYSFIGSGMALFARSYGEAVFGTYNLDYTPASASTTASTDRLFVIGNGTSSGSRSNALTVLKNGNVGIGTVNPAEPLTVKGHIQLSNANIPMGLTTEVLGNTPLLNMDINFRQSNKNTTFRGAAFRIDSRDNNPLFQWLTRSAGNTGTGSVLMVLNEGGSLGIGTSTPDPAAKLDVYGAIYQNGGVLHASDLRFKQNIEVISNAMSKLSKLSGVSYEFRTRQFKEQNFSEGSQLGLIAQEVESVFPELVKTREDGYKAVNYEGLIPVLIEAVKEQQTAIAAKEARIVELEANLARIDDLDELLTKADALEAKIAVLEKMESRIAQLEQNIQQCCQNYQPWPEQPIQTSPILLPEGPYLEQNRPNPFFQETSIQYYLPEGTQQAQLRVSDLSGKLLKTIPLEEMGLGTVKLDRNSLAPGTFLYTLVVNHQIVETKKMVLTK